MRYFFHAFISFYSQSVMFFDGIASLKFKLDKLINLDSILITLKVVSTTFLLVSFLSLKRALVKLEIIFYFISKALFVLEKIKF